MHIIYNGGALYKYIDAAKNAGPLDMRIPG
jgi:hypothetical protein